MAKRFTDTDKWADPWFCELPNNHKMFWVYILDNCDAAGIWKVNWPLARFHLGKYEYENKYFEKRIFEIKPDTWFIPNFIVFQYGELSEECNPHKPIIKLLKKNGLDGMEFKGTNTLNGTLKEQEQDKNKEGVVGETKIKFSEFVFLTQVQHNQLANKLGKAVLEQYVERLNNYIGSKGKKYKSHYHTILSWTAKDGGIKPSESKPVKTRQDFENEENERKRKQWEAEKNLVA